MGRLRGEYVYTCTGPQRPVFLWDGAGEARFCLEMQPGGEAVVQVTHDPAAAVRDGRAVWLDQEELAEGVYGVVALRVVVKKVDGWMTLVVEQARAGEAG